MSAEDFHPEGRNYPALFVALDDAMESAFEGDVEDAFRRSFESAAEGFGAEKALLLVTEGERFRTLASRGLSGDEIAACEAGHSVAGVSSSKIREARETRRPVLVQDPRHLLEAHQTMALVGSPCSVLVAPILPPHDGPPLALLYFQNHGYANAFGEIDRAWVEVYARALGRALQRGSRTCPHCGTPLA